MSLPSQSSRNATRSSQVHYRRSRSPLRKALSVLVVLALVVLVWFTLIRPRAAKISDELTETPTKETTTNGAADQPARTETSIAGSLGSEPVTIRNRAPDRNDSSRPLPGSGDRPDPARDVDRVLGSNPGSSNPSTITPGRVPPQGASSSDDILAAAAEQAQSNPAAQPQIEERRAGSGRDQPTSNPGMNSGASAGGIRLQLDAARRLVAENNRPRARELLSHTLLNANISAAEAQNLRDELTAINQVLLFSPVVDPKDPMSESYTIQSGDSLSKIAARRELATHWKLIQRVNRISDPSKIRLGQNIKLVRGPFHAIVNKSAHRIDIYHGSPADPGSWLYIRSFDVGLGASDGTPVGEFVVSENKLENPGWVNPRNAREQYAPEDPQNPIGEYWIGLTGVGQYESLTSLGIHGTIDPESIGSNQSMGCVRLADGDIDIVYELLAEHISRVLIVP